VVGYVVLFPSNNLKLIKCLLLFTLLPKLSICINVTVMNTSEVCEGKQDEIVGKAENNRYD